MMRLILGVSLILLLTSAGLAQPAPAGSSSQITGQILSVGFDNLYRPDAWTPMQVQLTSRNGDAANYQLQVLQDDLDGDHVLYTQPIEMTGLAEGQPEVTENFWVYFQPRTSQHGLPDISVTGGDLKMLSRELKVLLIDKTGRPVIALPITSSISNIDPILNLGDPFRSRHLVLFVTDGNDKPAIPDETDLPGRTEDIAAAIISPRDLPTNLLGYDGVDEIVWLDADAQQLATGTRTASLDALLQWVHAGGHLIVCEPAEPRKISPFADILPIVGVPGASARAAGRHANIDPIAMHDLADSQVLRQLATLNSSGNTAPLIGPFKIAYASPAPGAVVELWQPWKTVNGSEIYSPWLARRGYGTGAVTWVAQDPAQPALAAQIPTGWQIIWDRILSWDNPPNPLAYASADIPNPWMNSTALDLGAPLQHGMDLSNQAVSLVLIASGFFILYWLAAGPGVLVFLRLRDQPQWSWFAFAGAAVIATAVTGLIVHFVLGGPPQVKHLSIVRVDPDDANAVVDSRFGMYIPQDGEKKIALADSADDSVSYIAPLQIHPQYAPEELQQPLAQQYEVPVRSVSDADPPAIIVPYRSSSKKFRARWVGAVVNRIDVADDNPLRLTPPGPHGYIAGTLLNHTGVPLSDVYLAFETATPETSGLLATWVIYIANWPVDGAVKLESLTIRDNRLDLSVERKPDSPPQPAIFGFVHKPNSPDYPLAWETLWRHEADGESLAHSEPLLMLFEHIPPWGLDSTFQHRSELYRRGGRSLDLSAAVSGGSVAILATASPNGGDSSSPIPLPLLVAGRPITGTGTTLMEFVLPLDRSQVETFAMNQPATQPAQ